MISNPVSYNNIQRSEFFNEIFENLVKYNFNYKFDENGIVIFWEGKEAITYKYPGLLEHLKTYLMHRLAS